MAYVKQTWSCGDEISAEKLNHMEDGIYDASQSGGSVPLIVNAVSIESTGTSKRLVTDKTWQEVRNAIENGIPCYFGFAMMTNTELCEDITSLEDVLKGMTPIVYATQYGVDFCVTQETELGGSGASVISASVDGNTGIIVFPALCGSE